MAGKIEERVTSLLSFFDPAHYRQQLRDRGMHDRLAGSDRDLIADYIERGWSEGLDPSPDFSSAAYLEIYEDARDAHVNPLQHWLEHRETEGAKAISQAAYAAMPRGPDAQLDPVFKLQWKTAAPEFDESYYRETYPEVSAAGADPLSHYLLEGAAKGYNPRGDFATGHYVAANPDVLTSGLNPFVHWLVVGRSENRPLAPPAGVVARPMPNMTADQARLLRAAFDEDFYRSSNPDLGELPDGAFEHYMTIGWLEGRDPNREFSTSYYLAVNRDIADAGQNPFHHYVLYGKAEKRDASAYYARGAGGFQPLVSVVVPNYNHARYLPQRLQSIFQQTYRNIELILLDDASKDDSVEVLKRLCENSPFPWRLLANKKNAGNVSRQWRKGLAAARGELIWICESDDFCEPDFLEKLVRYFADRSVMLAFGRIQLTDEEGTLNPWLDQYRENAEPGIWHQQLVRPAFEWFGKAMGVNNVIANVGGCLFRNIPLPDSVWERAQQYRIVGDWYLYSNLAGGGRIAYDPGAVAYFRQHRRNTSAGNFDKLFYYRELEMVQGDLSALWPIPEETRQRFISDVRRQYQHFRMPDHQGPFAEALPALARKARPCRKEHVLIAMLGFSLGGGEIFAIHLANALAAAGKRVSVMAFSMDNVNPALLQMLDRRIPVYDRAAVLERGVASFLARAGITLIHSHMISCDGLFFDQQNPLENFPYVVTLHGSHDTAPPSTHAMLFRALRGVSHWVYLADKNLAMFRGMPLNPDAFTKIPNAMPADPRPFPKTRKELGIGPKTVVFTLAARGIQRKGWRAAAVAFKQLLERHPKADVHLLLAGEGEYSDVAAELLAGCSKFTALGFQSNISGLYRISDCAIVPTRYGGESYPLTIIQALQEGLPIIATDIGEIANMITGKRGQRAGILLPGLRDSEAYFAKLCDAMEAMLDPQQRRRFSANAVALSKSFNMDQLVKRYLKVYAKAMKRANGNLDNIL